MADEKARKMPPLNAVVFTCTGCTNWQLDAGPRPSRYAETPQAALMLIAEAHSEHLWGECVGGTEGRRYTAHGHHGQRKVSVCTHRLELQA